MKKIASLVKQHCLWWGPLLSAVVIALMRVNGWDLQASIAAGVATLCAVWWMFEPIPIPVTSLLPLGLFPLTGVLNGSEVAAAYGHPLVLLFVGGSLLSKAMEKTHTHHQLALRTVQFIGGHSSRRVVIGFMLASALLSMWISNTATVLMLLPIVLAVLDKAEDKKLAMPLLLGTAYGASIGGLATHIGSPPNLVFMSTYKEFTGEELTLVDWMRWGLPVVAIMLPIAALWLTRHLSSGGALHIPNPGAWTRGQKRVLWVFALTALAWVTRKYPGGGWQGILENVFSMSHANDAAVAFVAVIALFLIPSGEKTVDADGNVKSERLLDWEHAINIPWGIFILFAGGLAIASAFTSTGISEALGLALGGLADLHPLLMIALLCLTVTFLTEITSNTATATMLMPILAAAAIGADVNPALLMVPAAMSASCAFMLPVATPPNVIIFSANKMRVEDMAREGLVLNLVGVLVISGVSYFLLS